MFFILVIIVFVAKRPFFSSSSFTTQTPGPDDLYQMTSDPRTSPSEPERLEIHFRRGLPVRVVNPAQGKDISDPLEMFVHLNQVGGTHGVGRIDIVENRFIGTRVQ